MTKRRIENTIDELSDELLGDLSAAERRTLTLEAEATGRDNHVELLRSTCPIKQYRLPDLNYALQMQSLQSLALQAVSDLHRCLLHYERTQTRNKYRLQLLAERDEFSMDPTDTNLEIDPSDQPIKWIRELMSYYHGYERFAEEDLGVSLETWLALTENGSAIVETAEAVLADHESLPDTAFHRESDADNSVTPEEAGDQLYDILSDTWSGMAL